MAELIERVACRTPTPGRDGVTNIPKAKFDAIRSAMLAELALGDVPMAEMTARLGERLNADDLAMIGKLGWHMMAVKLELEVRGEVVRVADVSPQLLRLGRVVE